MMDLPDDIQRDTVVIKLRISLGMRINNLNGNSTTPRHFKICSSFQPMILRYFKCTMYPFCIISSTSFLFVNYPYHTMKCPSCVHGLSVRQSPLALDRKPTETSKIYIIYAVMCFCSRFHIQNLQSFSASGKSIEPSSNALVTNSVPNTPI
eukprot:TRINITY_DN28042_c0_g1_i1.p1 TRINITY_DN28042_c0_g1~~TRINITY_DN28042_c0_g1_i1.p1  ORF type:complete len:151 (-),score=2.95 TRINITY_DN28042_c0_g1_i1:193-645(-)